MKDRCPACYGAKKVMGMGMLMQNCRRCGGAGEVEITKPVFVAPVAKEVVVDDLPPSVEDVASINLISEKIRSGDLIEPKEKVKSKKGSK